MTAQLRDTLGARFGALRRALSFFGRSLKLKLVLLIVSVLGLTIGIAPWGAIKMQERQLLKAYDERLLALHEMVRKAVVDTCVLTGNLRSVQRVFEAISRHQQVERVRLFDTHGLIRYSSQRAERGERLSPAELNRYYGEPRPVLVPGNGKAPSYTFVQPLFNTSECLSCHPARDKVLGVLQVSLSLGSMQDQLGRLKQAAAVATGITLCVVVLGIWMALTHLVDQPLQQLVAVMGRAERGDLSARASTDRQDELGQLAQHFNDMLARLEAAQQELQRYHQQQLVRADRLATIGEMAAAIAHEIRNPLTGISGVLSVLSRDYPERDPRHEVVRQTHLLIDRLNKSVESILHYSRPAAPHMRRVELVEVVSRTLLLVRGEVRKARVQVIEESPPQDAARAPAVLADPQQLQQVLMNLVLNAVQASSVGGQIRVRTYARAAGPAASFACLEVEDNGKGMTDEQVEKAFQPFFSTKAEGTGLGLPIVKQIIERHQGRIEIRSAPGQGTCVTVELPMAPPDQTEEC